MNFLFFDIECANCFNGQGKICSFGYTIVDENFSVIEQKDLIINPKSRFHLGPFSGEPIIHLAYEEKEFEKHPDFSYYYEDIKNLLQRDNQIVFGHSVGNDISFILSECRRYEKPIFYIKAYDTQVIYKQIKNESNDIGLEKLCTIYNIESPFMHRSDSDAFVTMKVVENLCRENECSLLELLEQYPSTYIEVINGQAKKIFSTMSNAKRLYRLSRKIKVDKSKTIKQYNGKVIVFDNELEDDFEKAKEYLYYLRKSGGLFATKIKECDIYIQRNPESEKSQKIHQNIEVGKTIEIILEYDLSKIVNGKTEDLK